LGLFCRAGDTLRVRRYTNYAEAAA
jgi:hypothetical protein